MSVLGPHLVKFITKSGENGKIGLNISLDGPKRILLGGQDFVFQQIGSIHIVSSWLNKTITLQADNDIQLIMWLISTSDIYVKKLCSDNGIEISRYERGDIAESGSIYKP